jgi:hypothetical protein
MLGEGYTKKPEAVGVPIIQLTPVMNFDDLKRRIENR